MRLPMILSITTLVCACAPTIHITERGSKIQVHNQMSVLLANCKNLGPVTGETPGGNLKAEHSIPQAKAIIRDKAAELGGDTVVILNTDIFDGIPGRTVLQGVAMKCY